MFHNVTPVSHDKVSHEIRLLKEYADPGKVEVIRITELQHGFTVHICRHHNFRNEIIGYTAVVGKPKDQ